MLMNWEPTFLKQKTKQKNILLLKGNLGFLKKLIGIYKIFTL